MNNFKGELILLKMNNIKPNFSALAREYHMDRRTVKKRYNGDVSLINVRHKTSILDKYSDLIKDKLSIPGINMKSVYMYITMNIDNNIGSYSNFRKYIKKNSNTLLPSKPNVHLRFETDLGKQLQFDWKGPIKLHSKTNIEFIFYIFSATLSASRMHNFVYSKFMTLESVERCLIRTFEYFGGVSEELLTDNMASILNPSKTDFLSGFKKFCKDLGTYTHRCKIHCPETKGKDESCNRFMKWLLAYDKEFCDENELINIIENITYKVNQEVNQTTNMPPISLFEIEKEHLKPLPSQSILNTYLDTMIPAKVSNGLLVYYKGSQYSVPKEYINQSVKLEQIDNKLNIYYNKKLIAMHDITDKKINYQKEHYVDALSTKLSNKDATEIEELTNNNLALLDKLVK